MTGPGDDGDAGSDYLDGNAAAGPLSEVFAVDVTVASGRCAHCGRTGELATARVYPNSHGLLLRCPGCAEILLRLVDTGHSLAVDLHGMSYLELQRDAPGSQQKPSPAA
ncbi:DUF6510 family protein [Cryobacterium sp. SO2]|uniref:DUF6510 family protein n=1 Tax=Cryobacterium sp. SO2 TaxID=1897060 RepID=UPI00223DCB83|nr:DUF6510 family protein [Cryobacterium sp. SO2]WEO76256.1 DUF6510 family protein [Cryobacterium sp. SO2]